METDILFKIEVLSSERDDQYRLTREREILFVLRGIAAKKSRIALYYNDTNDFILTTLLAADSTGIWLEQSNNGAQNRQIVSSEKLIVVGSHGQVKIQFTAEKPSETVYQDCASFHLPLPSHLYRLQRREYFRLIAPVEHPLHCIIKPNRPPATLPRAVTIMDISGGGVGLTCAENDTELVPGLTYPNCEIELPEEGRITGSIEVKNLVVLTDADGNAIKRAGCQFHDLESSDTIKLQRYVNNMQRNKAS